MSGATQPLAATSRDVLDIEAIRDQFPALAQEIGGQPLVYLDSAATSLKPQAVIDAVTEIYARDCGNVHRAVHTLSARATQKFEAAREVVRSFLGATSRDECIFVRGTTEAINLVAQSYARPRLGPGDEILITGLEHHSNIVPWQMVRDATGATLAVAPIDERGDVPLLSILERIGPQTRIVACAHASNSLGTVLPLRDIAKRAHEVGAVVVVDGAQGAPHLGIDVAAADCDFYAFSAHKLYGPTGVGVLYGRRELLESMSPVQGGGDMIRTVTLEKSTYADIPYRFEAGTPNIAGVVGMAAAIEWLSSFGAEAVAARERALTDHAARILSEVPGLRLFGSAPGKIGVFSFTLEGVHPHDLGTVVDAEGVAIRTGQHCAQPVMDFFAIPATARASLGIYSSEADIDKLVAALGRAREMFA